MQSINIRNERGNFTKDPTDIKKNLKKFKTFTLSALLRYILHTIKITTFKGILWTTLCQQI